MYLAVLGLSCSTQALQSSLQHGGALVAAFKLYYSMWDLVPWLGIEPWPSAMGVWILSHWTTREVTKQHFFFLYKYVLIIAWDILTSKSIAYLKFQFNWMSYFYLSNWLALPSTPPPTVVSLMAEHVSSWSWIPHNWPKVLLLVLN